MIYLALMKVFYLKKTVLTYPSKSLMANNSICFIISDFLYDIKIVKIFNKFKTK